MASENITPTVTIIKGHLADQPQSFFLLYRLQLDYSALLLIDNATALYADFFCGRFNGILSLLKHHGYNVDITTELELLTNLKAALSPELSLTDTYDIQDFAVRALTKMSYDIHNAIQTHLSQETTDKKSRTNTQINPASAEITPDIAKVTDRSNNTYYLIDLSDRLFFTLSKALHMYEAFSSGQFKAILELSATNGLNESRLIDLNNVLHTMNDAYFINNASATLSQKTKTATALRSLIEQHHPDLKGSSKIELTIDAGATSCQEDNNSVEMETKVISSQPNRRTSDRNTFKQNAAAPNEAREQFVSFIKESYKWFIPAVLGICLAISGVGYFAIHAHQRQKTDSAENSNTKTALNTRPGPANNAKQSNSPAGAKGLAVSMPTFVTIQSHSNASDSAPATGSQPEAQHGDTTSNTASVPSIATNNAVNTDKFMELAMRPDGGSSPDDGADHISPAAQLNANGSGSGERSSPGGLGTGNGEEVLKNDPQPAGQQEKSADQDDPEAQYNLGVKYQLGAGLPQDYAQAAKWYRKAAEKGLAKARFSLGFLYRTGRGVENNDLEAVGWFQKSADQGNADAQYNLGVMYQLGKGVIRNSDEAAKWYAKAAGQDHAMAQQALGLLFEKGEGVTQDDARAVDWYGKAAAKDLASAQFFYGMMYRRGGGVTKNEAQAVTLIQKGANHFEKSAEQRMEQMYLKVKAVMKDDAQTAKWFQNAAARGDLTAQFLLGLMYREGKGVAKDEAEALKSFQKAAGQGEIHSQEELGFMYASGRGVPRDDAQAQTWFRKAAGQGYPTW